MHDGKYINGVLETTQICRFYGRWRDLAWLDLKCYVEGSLRLRRLQAKSRLESTPIDKLFGDQL